MAQKASSFTVTELCIVEPIPRPSCNDRVDALSGEV